MENPERCNSVNHDYRLAVSLQKNKKKKNGQQHMCLLIEMSFFCFVSRISLAILATRTPGRTRKMTHAEGNNFPRVAERAWKHLPLSATAP